MHNSESKGKLTKKGRFALVIGVVIFLMMLFNMTILAWRL